MGGECGVAAAAVAGVDCATVGAVVVVDHGVIGRACGCC
jgi:hypothetical protein